MRSYGSTMFTTPRVTATECEPSASPVRPQDRLTEPLVRSHVDIELCFNHGDVDPQLREPSVCRVLCDSQSLHFQYRHIARLSSFGDPKSQENGMVCSWISTLSHG
jgi:hypothetical protein